MLYAVPNGGSFLSIHILQYLYSDSNFNQNLKENWLINRFATILTVFIQVQLDTTSVL